MEAGKSMMGTMDSAAHDMGHSFENFMKMFGKIFLICSSYGHDIIVYI